MVESSGCCSEAVLLQSPVPIAESGASRAPILPTHFIWVYVPLRIVQGIRTHCRGNVTCRGEIPRILLRRSFIVVRCTTHHHAPPFSDLHEVWVYVPLGILHKPFTKKGPRRNNSLA